MFCSFTWNFLNRLGGFSQDSEQKLQVSKMGDEEYGWKVVL